MTVNEGTELILSTEQRIEMLTEIRRYRSEGRPEKAAVIVNALENGRYSLGGVEPVDVEGVSEPNRGDDTDAWKKFAHSVSDFDTELIDSTRKVDLIKMLEANGIIERRSPEEMAQLAATAANAKRLRDKKKADDAAKKAAALIPKKAKKTPVSKKDKKKVAADKAARGKRLVDEDAEYLDRFGSKGQ